MKDRELFAENITLSSEEIVAAILSECEIDSPPTEADKLFKFLGLKRTYFPAKDAQGDDRGDVDQRIRAALDIKKKTVFLSPLLAEKQYNFTSFHELAHFVLPEHRDTLYQCSQEDISQFAKGKMEYEANAFAADCIFQLERFSEMANNLPREVSSIFQLANLFQSSYESALIRYVERNPLPTALVVYVREGGQSEDPPLKVQYSVRSTSFKYFTSIETNQKVPRREDLYELTNVKDVTHIVETPLRVSVLGGKKISFDTVCFTNSYKVFQLILDALPQKKKS